MMQEKYQTWLSFENNFRIVDFSDDLCTNVVMYMQFFGFIFSMYKMKNEQCMFIVHTTGHLARLKYYYTAVQIFAIQVKWNQPGGVKKSSFDYKNLSENIQ